MSVKTPGGHHRIPQNEIDRLLHNAKSPETPKRRMMRTISGRNQLSGRIVELIFAGLVAQVKLLIDRQILTSIITADAAREMNLAVGQTATALFKSTSTEVLRR